LDKTAIDQKKEARLKEWRTWITTYLETNDDSPLPEYTTIEYAAELLNDYYWRLVKQFIRPLLQEGISPEEHNIHYYKIISASELTVMAVLPLIFKESNTQENRALINAEFAFFVATTIMLNWTIKGNEIVSINELEQVALNKELIDISTDNEPIHYPYNFRDEHIDWLKELNTSGPLPIISNSQTWRLCCHACLAIRNGGKL